MSAPVHETLSETLISIIEAANELLDWTETLYEDDRRSLVNINMNLWDIVSDTECREQES